MKSRITIYIDSDLRKALEKRAAKEMLSLEELVIDIVRRSAVSYKGKSQTVDNVDDKFLTFFSRKTTIKKKKAKP
jgi:hypothetical protein